MVEEGWGSFESGRVQEQITESSEQNVVKVREDLKQAKKVKQQIQKSQKKNRQHAQLLTILLQEVTDDQLVNHLGNHLFDHNVPVPFVFAQFLPYLNERRDLSKYLDRYPGVAKLRTESDRTLSGYATYLTNLKATCAELQEVPLDEYVSFVFRLFVWMQLIAPKDWTDEKQKSFVDSLRKQLGSAQEG